jgi:hypothetical protein
MHDSFDIARRDINRDALLEAIGGRPNSHSALIRSSLSGTAQCTNKPR